MAETHALITSIIRLTVETGSLTGLSSKNLLSCLLVLTVTCITYISAIISVISLILTYLPGQPSYYRTTVSVLAKLYSNSMMVVLNSRMRVVSGNSVSMAHEIILPMSKVAQSTEDSQSRMGTGNASSVGDMTFTGLHSQIMVLNPPL